MKRLVFDWNGTMYEDVDLSLHCVNKLLKKYGLPEIKSREHYRSVFDFPVIEYYKKIGFDFDELDWDKVANEFMDEYIANTHRLFLYHDVLDVLEESKRRGYDNIILSASQIENLNNQLRPFHLENLVSKVYGIEDIYANSKEKLAHQLKEDCAEDDEIIFLGDTVHDAEVAKAIGARCILIDRGHQSRERLLSQGVPVVSNLKEALELIS